MSSEIDDLRALGETSERLRSVEMAVGNVSQLWRKVGKPDVKELEKLSKVQTNLKTAAQNYEEVFKTGLILSPDPTAYGGHRYPFGELQKNTEILLKQTKEMSNQVFSEVERIRVEDESHLHTVKWASYVLFTLGWGLALIGRIYGVETGGGE